MVKLRQDTNGKFVARKRLPDDVREEYGRRYGARFEAKFSAPAKVGPHAAKQMFREWDAEVTGRIATIRAERNGEGIPLTPQQARALAGEWYEWFIARHPASDLRQWEALRDEVHEAMREAVGDAEWERSEPDDLWRDDEELRRTVRPILADVGETAQFLAMKRQTLSKEAHDRFVDWLYYDLSAALRRLIRHAHGDYRDDGYAKQFPKFEATDAGETPQQLFDRWVSERKPAASTVDTWRYFFSDMSAHFEGRSGGSISPHEAQAWITGLVSKERSAATVRTNWLRASKTVFGWATEHKLIPRNPFADVKITVPKKVKLRETQAFLPDERRIILKAALEVGDTDTPDKAARRWVPWLCAYTGARPGEISQLRGSDVIERDGVPAIRITPGAGAVKGGKARVVPLHEHLIAQGFLEFVHRRGTGPLFYNPPRLRSDDGTRMKKPRAIQARQRLASWVRGLGITDAELSPLHGWRHTFKQIADRAGISERTSDYITGHANKSVGAAYGAPTLDDMAEALKKFPRYALE
jgi:integrase